MSDSQIVINGMQNAQQVFSRNTDTGQFSRETCNNVLQLHQSLPGYTPTPLHQLNNLADRLGVANIWVKDESYRFGLNAFKSLGASYAIATHILGSDIKANFEALRAKLAMERSANVTFVTATDGNHGCAVAWFARLLGVSSVVYMPHGSQHSRVEAIQLQGGNVEVLDGSYDDAVIYAANMAKRNTWTLIQDTAWDAYTDIPLAIMQGYTTLLTEVYQQLEDQKPTHVFIQAGVGSLAAAVQAVLIERSGLSKPKVVITEPIGADCYFQSMQINDGAPHSIKGHLATTMAGLACGTPSSIAWPIIRDYSDYFFRCSDKVTESGMRILASPDKGDQSITSGESGAVTIGLLAELMTNPSLTKHAGQLNLHSNSRILLISTEGDTDPANYLKVINR